MHQQPEVQTKVIQIDPSHTKALACACGNETYQMAVKMLAISRIISPNGKDAMMNQNIWKCTKCGLERDEKSFRDQAQSLFGGTA